MKFKLVSSITAALMVIGLGITASPASAAGTYGQYVSSTNDLLDGLEADHGITPGWTAGREMFNLASVSKVRWKQIGILCQVYDLSAKDGQFTKAEIRSAAQMVWKSEKTLVDMFTSAGASSDDLDDFELVNFSTISNGVNVRCPRWNSLTLGRFSDALYALYDAYAH